MPGTVFAAVFFLISVPAYGAPVHPSVLAEMRARGDTCGWSCPAGVGNLWVRASAPVGLSGGSAGYRAPNKTANPVGTVKVAVLPIQFQTDAVTTTTGTGNFKDDGQGDTTRMGDSIAVMMSRADTYFRAVSYGRMKLSYTVFDTAMVTLSQTMDVYSATQNQLRAMITEALGRADASIGFAAYDAVVMFHAGAASQITLESRDIGAQFFNDLTPYTDVQDGGQVTHVIIMAAFGKVLSGDTVTMLGTFCHEFGHALGLPDLYSTGTGSGGIGDWGLMGTGNYAGRPQGDSPSWMDPWCREYLGWADTKTLDTGQTISSFKRAQEDSTIYKIKAKASVDTEYFLLEVREPKNSGVDSAPGSGLLIWHIDNSMGLLGNNNVNALSVTVPHRRVDIEEADASDVGSSGSPFSGDGADPWPGSGGKTEFGDNSTPSSRGYTDTIARFAIKSISQGSSITFTVDFTDVTVAVTTKATFPSACVVERWISPWPEQLAHVRAVRDWMLTFSCGRAAVGRYYDGEPADRRNAAR